MNDGNTKNGRGILLYSGGLDSLLAAKLLLDQGLEIRAINFLLPFYPPHADPRETKAAKIAASIGLKVEFIRLGEDYMKMVENPSNGWGKLINPCIDCKIYLLKKAAQIMRDEGYDFVATGEVLGQRPMSQQRNRLNQIEKETGLAGYLLRPLTAKHLAPTLAEERGLVDRNLLLDIHGRSRDRQMALAKDYGITDYATPAGGCLFTDSYYAERLGDLLENTPSYRIIDVYLCSIGRHFRLSPECKMVLSRDAAETEILLSYKSESDVFVYSVFRGPVGFIRGEASAEDLNNAASILLKYGKKNETGANIVRVSGAVNTEFEVFKPADDEMIEKFRAKWKKPERLSPAE